ncbi:MAG: M18 family aminopeptidase [Chlamydia sp. 32-24]|nr:MAG: M18 family aminopeptidase [Chlamydia sp. 32-24]
MIMKQKDSYLNDLKQFLDSSPTAWHATQNIENKLKQCGYKQIDEKKPWDLKGHKFFVKRNNSSIIAFNLPKQKPNTIHLVASHTDSPALKLKPNSEFRRANELGLSVEIYGSPLLSSWLNRDLGIAGQVIIQKGSSFEPKLLNYTKHPLIIPQLAIHLDRNVNENGLVLNKQEHLNALAAINFPENSSYLETVFKECFFEETVIAHDLFLYPLQKSSLIGYNNSLISSYRIDNLLSAFASLEALIELDSTNNTLQMAVFWDHEEVGSNTYQGASSPFFEHTLERILSHYQASRDTLLELIPNSMCLSVDLAHGFHLNHAEKLEAQHKCLLGNGIVIKTNAQQRYATNALGIANILNLCQKNSIPYQLYANRNDIPCGSTVGPIHATQIGMPTVDIGLAQLSMHSAREVASCEDYLHLKNLLINFYKI